MRWAGPRGSDANPLAFAGGEGISFEWIPLAGLLGVALVALAHNPAISITIFASQAALLAYLVLRRLRRRKRRDQAHVLRLAERAGLRQAAPGEFDLLRLPFPMFRTGEWQGFDNVFVGDWEGERVWVFDSWYGFAVRGQDVEEFFTCAAIEIDADCPKLSITREKPWSRTWEHLGWSDIQVESEDFNRRFHVSGDDERFAFAFLAPSMIQWLQRAPKEYEFAVEGRWVLCRSKWVPIEKWWELLRMARDFRASMPKTLGRLWPGSVSPRASRSV